MAPFPALSPARTSPVRPTRPPSRYVIHFVADRDDTCCPGQGGRGRACEAGPVAIALHGQPQPNCPFPHPADRQAQVGEGRVTDGAITGREDQPQGQVARAAQREVSGPGVFRCPLARLLPSVRPLNRVYQSTLQGPLVHVCGSCAASTASPGSFLQLYADKVEDEICLDAVAGKLGTPSTPPSLTPALSERTRRQAASEHKLIFYLSVPAAPLPFLFSPPVSLDRQGWSAEEYMILLTCWRVWRWWCARPRTGTPGSG